MTGEEIFFEVRPPSATRFEPRWAVRVDGADWTATGPDFVGAFRFRFPGRAGLPPCVTQTFEFDH